MATNECAIIIQARMSSQRFPCKMMLPLAGIPLIEYVFKRCSLSFLKNVIVATSDDVSDDRLYDYCKNRNIPIVRRDLHNVLNRYIETAELIKAKYIIRVCGDTPLVDFSLTEEILSILISNDLDYVSLDRATCASGFYSEAVSLKALKKASVKANSREDSEHVTKYIIDNKGQFSTGFIDAGLNPKYVRDVRLTIDYPQDMENINTILAELDDKFSFQSKQILDIVRKKGF